MKNLTSNTRPNIGKKIQQTYKDLLIIGVFKGDKELGEGIYNSNNWKITVKNTKTGEKVKFYFWSSISYPDIRTKEEIISTLYCFVSDAISGEQSFEDFCNEFLYDTDSINAKKAWKSCKKSLEKLGRIYDGDVYDLANELSEIVG